MKLAFEPQMVIVAILPPCHPTAATAAVRGSNSCCHNQQQQQQQQKREILRAQSIIDLNIHGTVSENCVRLPLINTASSSGTDSLLCHPFEDVCGGQREGTLMCVCGASIKRHLQRLFVVANNLMKYSVCHVISCVPWRLI